MTDPNPRIGRDISVETNYATICTYVVDGNKDDGLICAAPALIHVRWFKDNTENGFACEGHQREALAFEPYDIHGVEPDCACGLPGAFWVLGSPSHCELDPEEIDKLYEKALAAMYTANAGWLPL